MARAWSLTMRQPRILKHYAALRKHYTTSQVAVLRANALPSDIVSTAIPAVRTQTLMYYILAFFAKVREYNKIVPSHNIMDDAQQLTHFKNHIHIVTELKQTTVAIGGIFSWVHSFGHFILRGGIPYVKGIF